jgi:acyl-coenzyme A synthetase/AMP-(fatty) acid ligase
VDTEDGFVGHVLPWVEVQVVDEIGEVQPVGREGIFRVKSPEAALYISAGGDRQELHEDGWFYPGDVGRLGADGTIYVTGRSSEVINRGGSVVAPEAIEDVLRLNPNIADVAVVGITNADGVEEIWAAVVSDRLIDPAAVIAAARPRLNEKVPDHVVQVPSIPRAESAKVRRFQLREILQARKHASG